MFGLWISDGTTFIIVSDAIVPETVAVLSASAPIQTSCLEALRRKHSRGTWGLTQL